MSEGKIVSEYEDYSLWESPFSPSVRIVEAREEDPPNTYRVAYSYIVKVSTYEDALLEPEWDVFQ